MHIKFLLYGGLLALGLRIALFVAPLAHAQNTNPSLLTDLYACQTLETAVAKSECYDYATRTLQDAEKQSEIVILNGDEYKKIQEGVFGYKHTTFSNIGTETGSENIARANTLKTMTIPVKKVERYLSGYVITLDNNQVWEQFAGNISRVPKGKLSAEIKTTPTGIYKMALFNAKSRVSNIKVRRIQ